MRIIFAPPAAWFLFGCQTVPAPQEVPSTLPATPLQDEKSTDFIRHLMDRDWYHVENFVPGQAIFFAGQV
jgi:hypothetical protein